MNKIIYILMFLSVTVQGYSHHAMDFIQVESYSTVKSNQFGAYLHYDYKVDNKEKAELDHWELTPGISYGITNKLMFDMHTHFAKFNNGHIVDSKQADYSTGLSPFIEAAAVSMQYRITEERTLPINLATNVAFELPMPRAVDLLDGGYVWAATVIAGYDWGLHNNITLNLGYEGEYADGKASHAGNWALGFKFVLSTVDEHAPAFGIEILGDFEGAMGVMPGLYINIAANTILKTGITFGLNGYENDIRAHVSIMRAW